MTKGIRVLWPGSRKGSVDEIEYIEGVDVDDLKAISEFKRVSIFLPAYGDGGTWIDYVVQTRCKPGPERKVHLDVTYSEAQNAALIEEHGDVFDWGTNTIVLQGGKQSGRCIWRPCEDMEWENPWWEAFDVRAPRGKSLPAAQRAKRDERFRDEILALDKQCVVSKEGTRAALQAAHLVPAKQGRNDVPSNGIALRADLHALFDARMFTFGRNGAVKVPRNVSGLSRGYRQLLRGESLPPTTYQRVKSTLALPEFVNR